MGNEQREARLQQHQEQENSKTTSLMLKTQKNKITLRTKILFLGCVESRHLLPPSESNWVLISRSLLGSGFQTLLQAEWKNVVVPPSLLTHYANYFFSIISAAANANALFTGAPAYVHRFSWVTAGRFKYCVQFS